MYEFDSVSVSSFEASALASKLSEKSGAGWDVVAVVNAGSDVIAYLRRGDGAANSSSTSANSSAAADTAAAKVTETESQPAGEVDTAPPVADTGASSPSGSGGVGWASSDDTSSASTGDSSWGSGAGSGAWSGSAQQQAPAAPPAAAVTPQVPAGWYADPAGRFELRYWDGTAWTEHVSRAGQQSTDPPVA